MLTITVNQPVRFKQDFSLYGYTDIYQFIVDSTDENNIQHDRFSPLNIIVNYNGKTYQIYNFGKKTDDYYIFMKKFRNFPKYRRLWTSAENIDIDEFERDIIINLQDKKYV